MGNYSFTIPDNFRHKCLEYKHRPIEPEDKQAGCIGHVHVNGVCIHVFATPEGKGEVFDVVAIDIASEYPIKFKYSILINDGHLLPMNTHVDRMIALVHRQLVAVNLDLRASFRRAGMICHD